MKVFKLIPKFKDVIWGGKALRRVYGMNIPTDTTGEAFVASVVSGYVSDTEGESFLSLAKDVKKTGEGGFNLLFKIIDAREKLSVQVHPNDELAALLEGGKGKTECWYVLSAREGAFLYLGFKEGVTKDDFSSSLHEGGLEKILNKVPVRAGDFFFVPSGTVHAIGEGLLIAELQQSCDITYRVYDYDRRDKEGKKRPLHTEKALMASDVKPYKNEKPLIIGDGRKRLAACEYFTVERVEGKLADEKTNRRYMLLFFERGEAKIIIGNDKVKAKAGDTFFISAEAEAFKVEGDFCYLAMRE